MVKDSDLRIFLFIPAEQKKYLIKEYPALPNR